MTSLPHLLIFLRLVFCKSAVDRTPMTMLLYLQGQAAAKEAVKAKAAQARERAAEQLAAKGAKAVIPSAPMPASWQVPITIVPPSPWLQHSTFHSAAPWLQACMSPVTPSAGS